MWGGAIATLGTFVAMAAISVIWTYRMNPYRVETVRLLKLGGMATAIAVLYYAVPVRSLPGQIGWSLLLMTMFPAGLWMLRFPTPGEWQALSSGIRRMGSRLYGAAAEA